MTGTSTVPPMLDLRRQRRARWVRRVFIAGLFAFVGLGLAGRMGVRSATVTDTAHGYDLTVTYASATRPGLDTPFDIMVRHRGGFRGQLTVALQSSYLDLFDKNGGLDPDPTRSSSDGRYVYWTFQPGASDTFTASLDAITAPGQQWGRVGHLRLLIGGRPVIGVTFHTWVMP